MARGALQVLLRRQPETRALMAVLAQALGGAVTVEDAEGGLVHGDRGSGDDPRYPVQQDEEPLGWVSGPAAAAMASLLEHLLARESERKALGAEVLHLYREVNLIYSFSEKLAALLEVDRVAALTLREARHLIVATDGTLLLLDEASGTLTSVAHFGDEMGQMPMFRHGQGIIGAVSQSGLSEIVNDLEQDPRRVIRTTALRALVAAPLKVGERTIGVLALGSTVPMAYTAAESKLLTTLALQAATAIENARLFERALDEARERERLQALHRDAEVARARLESELTLAARIQADLFPAVMPEVKGYSLSARNRPARQCGGDYYDALAIETAQGQRRLLVCVADVAGKGLPAALVMSNMQATLRALLGRVTQLPDLAAEASALLFGTTAPEKYVTAALVDICPEDGRLDWVGAGHVDNVILRASGEIVPLVSTGTPLGLLPPGVPYGEARHVLAPGDTLVLFSDGVTEAQNAAGEEFGDERLVEVLRTGASLPVDALIDRVFAALDAFVGSAPQFDDITLLAMRRDAALDATWTDG